MFSLVRASYPSMESLRLRNARDLSVRLCPPGNTYLVWAHRICESSLAEVATWPRPLSVGCLLHFPSRLSSSPPISRRRRRRRRRESSDTCPLNWTYGKNGPSSFLYCCPHYSLKIPPKKRRRFSKTFWPLSHVSKTQCTGRVPWVQQADVTWRASLCRT